MRESTPQRGRSPGDPTPYQILRPLARGGMGEVMLAIRREGTFTRTFAMKRLHPHLREDEEVRRMFLDEARIAGLLSHPHLISVVDVGENDDGPFLVMEYVQGVSVAQIIQKASTEERKVPLQFAVHVARQAAAGLQAAHEATSLDGKPLDLVHRDISPHNLLVGFDGITRVTDFGIARAVGRTQKTSTGVLKGKLGYMSPEQLSFRGQNQLSDLFSFGVTFYELLAARRLYPSNDGEKTARRIMDEPPPDILDDRDDVPPELAELLFRVLAKDPALRPASAGEVASILKEIETDLSEELGPFDASQFLQDMFSEEQKEAATLLAQSLEQADWVDQQTPIRTPSFARRNTKLFVGVGGVLALGLFAWGWAGEFGRASTQAGEKRALSNTPAAQETTESVADHRDATVAMAPRATDSSDSPTAASEKTALSEPQVPKTAQEPPPATTSTSRASKTASPAPRPTPQRTKTGVKTWDW